MLIRSTIVALAGNGWVYEKVCLYNTFKLPQLLIANFLIHLVIHSTVY